MSKIDNLSNKTLMSFPDSPNSKSEFLILTGTGRKSVKEKRKRRGSW
jgi:hypothetical protein